MVNLDQIQFNGAGYEAIQINGATPIGNPTGGAGDVQWVRGIRDQPDTSAAWTTSQSAPAAFTRFSNMHAAVKFSGTSAAISSFTVKGINSGAYGDFTEQTITLAGGSASSNFTTANTVSGIEANTLTFNWQIDSYTVAGTATRRICQSKPAFTAFTPSTTPVWPLCLSPGPKYSSSRRAWPPGRVSGQVMAPTP